MNDASFHTRSSSGLRIADLSVAYEGRPALSSVSLEIPARGITAVVGPSGCGKTTLLSSINRLTDLIPGCRVSGRIVLQGEDLLQANNPLAVRRRIGMVFQKPNPFPMSIRKNLALPLREHGCPRRAIDGIASSALQDVGLWDEVRDRLDRSALELSGGQQQRLCIARALCLQPEVLLFDEPCSALDPVSSRTVEELIVSLRSRVTVLVVTHNLAQARRIADHVAVIWPGDSGGAVVESGPAAEVFAKPKHPDAAAYLAGTIA
jgi:phosphate transport system ATP-binding protein